MFCCTLLCVHSSIAIILMWKRELVALLGLSSWCLVVVEQLFLAVPQGCLQFMIVVFHDHTHLLFLACPKKVYRNLSKINLNSVPLFSPPLIALGNRTLIHASKIVNEYDQEIPQSQTADKSSP